ncbi:uncharacterized protein [Littorina saxatilis]|uniref:uncharacterized protein n=1 Tax=Littorina saxatilis TaxID=31220 RepID=UPI0038B5633F
MAVRPYTPPPSSHYASQTKGDHLQQSPGHRLAARRREQARSGQTTWSVPFCRGQTASEVPDHQQRSGEAEVRTPKKTTQREDRFIRRQALQQRGTTANITRGQLRVATNTNVSTKTIRKRLHGVGLRSRRPAVRPRLTAAHRQARLAFCHNRARWTRQQWADVLFSDESRFNLHHHDGRARVWRRSGAGEGGLRRGLHHGVGGPSVFDTKPPSTTLLAT